VQRGGALAQALAKRAENKRIAREPIDTKFSRFYADSEQALGRGGEVRGLARAQRENKQFGLDATAQKFYQADIPLPLPDAAAASPGAPARRKRKPRVPVPYGNRMK
jgi:hypothetical protein